MPECVRAPCTGLQEQERRLRNIPQGQREVAGSGDGVPADSRWPGHLLAWRQVGFQHQPVPRQLREQGWPAIILSCEIAAGDSHTRRAQHEVQHKERWTAPDRIVEINRSFFFSQTYAPPLQKRATVVVHADQEESQHVNLSSQIPCLMVVIRPWCLSTCTLAALITASR